MTKFWHFFVVFLIATVAIWASNKVPLYGNLVGN